MRSVNDKKRKRRKVWINKINKRIRNEINQTNQIKEEATPDNEKKSIKFAGDARKNQMEN